MHDPKSRKTPSKYRAVFDRHPRLDCDKRARLDHLERLTGIHVATALTGALLLVALSGWLKGGA